MDEDNFSNTNYSEVIKTLTAIANRGKGTKGYVLIGIADKKKDAERFYAFYGQKYIKVGNFYICGVQAEIAKDYIDSEQYRRIFETELRRMNIEPDYYISQILEKMEFVDYYDKSILILEIEGRDDPIKFDGTYYIRQNTSTVPEKNERQLWQRFLL